jgi:hypothetical protein
VNYDRLPRPNLDDAIQLVDATVAAFRTGRGEVRNNKTILRLLAIAQAWIAEQTDATHSRPCFNLANCPTARTELCGPEQIVFEQQRCPALADEVNKASFDLPERPGGRQVQACPLATRRPWRRSMGGTDGMLALIARNDDLLKLVAATRGRAREAA